MEGFDMENEKSEKGRTLEIVFLGAIVVLLVVQSLFSIFKCLAKNSDNLSISTTTI